MADCSTCRYAEKKIEKYEFKYPLPVETWTNTNGDFCYIVYEERESKKTCRECRYWRKHSPNFISFGCWRYHDGKGFYSVEGNSQICEKFEPKEGDEK